MWAYVVGGTMYTKDKEDALDLAANIFKATGVVVSIERAGE